MEDDTAKLDFDLACAFRLELYDATCREAQAKLIAKEVAKLFNGDQSGED